MASEFLSEGFLVNCDFLIYFLTRNPVCVNKFTAVLVFSVVQLLKMSAIW